jgi:M6 family metalloprotease-like protein
MKKLLILLLWSTTLFAVPAKRTPTAVSQPDGTVFNILGFGDERYNFAETPEGYVVVLGADQYWYYANLNAEGRFTPSSYRVQAGGEGAQSRTLMNIPRHLRESREAIAEQMQTHNVEQNLTANTLSRIGASPDRVQASTKRILILCVRFSDLASTETAASFQSMVNDDGWKSGVGGMSAYYKEVSYNTVSVQADYRPWITATNPSSYYAYSNANFSTHLQELIRQCIDSAEAGGVDFSLYDNDGDGVVDGLFVVHAGIGAEEGSQTQYIWSLQSALSASYQRSYDGKTESRFIILPEKFGSGHVDIGVFCHEYGHMLGLPDLYDSDGSTNGASEGLGNWCLMAGGSWGGNGSSPERPAHMSAYCKSLLGYTTPTLITSNQVLSVPQAETNAFAYKIWMDDNQSDEYMLIENREKTGFDANLASSGLLIYHVDKNLADIWAGSNNINVSSSHLGVKLYEADGLEQMASGNNRGDAGDPYPGSSGATSLTTSGTPNTALWNASASGITISSISGASATMTATAVLPIYYGYNTQFYRHLLGVTLGSSGSNTGYGMVKCTPASTGKLIGVRVLSWANWFTSLSAAAFSTFSGNALSNQQGSTVNGSSAAVDNFVQLNFSPAIDVTAGVPVYVRVFFQVHSGGYAVPVDNTAPVTGNSYYSAAGATYSKLTSYDVAVRVVFRGNAALPIELASFTAATLNSRMILTWRTASEVNNYGFEVQKDTARDQHTFVTIPGSFIRGHGTSLEPRTYSFVDSAAMPGAWVYRLKQFDLDGTEHVSDPVQTTVTTTGVAEDQDRPGTFVLLQNYPNPFNPMTVVSCQSPVAGHLKMTVYDILGREVAVLMDEWKEPGKYRVRWDASHCASGIYYCRLEAGDVLEMKKMILLR